MYTVKVLIRVIKRLKNEKYWLGDLKQAIAILTTIKEQNNRIKQIIKTQAVYDVVLIIYPKANVRRGY